MSVISLESSSTLDKEPSISSVAKAVLAGLSGRVDRAGGEKAAAKGYALRCSPICEIILWLERTFYHSEAVSCLQQAIESNDKRAHLRGDCSVTVI